MCIRAFNVTNNTFYLDLPFYSDANIEKGKDIVKELGAVIKRDLTPAVEAPDLTAKEHSDRKMQQGRYMKDYKEVVQIYTEVSCCS